MAGAVDKRAQREAAERLERGVDCYGAGDYAGAERELEAAIALDPDNARARLHLGWVRDLLAGRRQVKERGAVDEDALQLVADALPEGGDGEPGDGAHAEGDGPHAESDGGEGEKTRERRSSSPELDSPWDPVPLLPGQGAHLEPPAKIAATILGVQPTGFDAPQLTPTRRPQVLYPTDENTASKTREWRGTPTGTNLPLLDVPELTEAQVQELLALDGAPLVALDAPPVLELEAEPTPLPHRSPIESVAPLEESPRRPRDATSPGVVTMAMEPELMPAGFELGPPFNAAEEFEQTPTRERRDILRSVLAARSTGDALELQPADAPVAADDPDEPGGTNPTTPFVRSKLREYVPPQAPPPKLEELPLPPAPDAGAAAPEAPGRDTRETPALQTIDPVQDALDRGDGAAAFDAAEAFLAEAGGLESERAKPQLWLFERVYELTIGPLARTVAHGRATPDLDPRSAFLLSRLDGMSSAEDLLDVSGMPRVEALRLLALLVRRGVVVMK